MDTGEMKKNVEQWVMPILIFKPGFQMINQSREQCVPAPVALVAQLPYWNS